MIVENMHDIPYVRAAEISPEIVAMMTTICVSVRQIIPKTIPCGLQVGYYVFFKNPSYFDQLFNVDTSCSK